MVAVVDQDATAELVERIETASAEGRQLAIVGHGSKQFYGRQSTGEPLQTDGHRGVIDYEPGDLVIRARSGTPLAEIEALLAEQGQCLGFEPPRFAINGAPAGTLGGAIAAGLSGPRRPWAGAARDFVLGVKMVNGLGHSLYFGGQLIKNVAGFDVPKLMAGSLGTLGLLLDIAIRVLPIRPAQVTLQQQLSAQAALAKMIEWQRQPLPISGLVYADGILSIRLVGTAEGVESARSKIGGDELAGADRWWDGLRDQRWGWFSESGDTWRVSCAAAAELAELDGDWIIDWGGAQRWYRGNATPAALTGYAQRIDGSLSCFRSGDSATQVQIAAIPFLSPQLLAIHDQLKHAFDPHRVFDGGRLLAPGAGKTDIGTA